MQTLPDPDVERIVCVGLPDLASLDTLSRRCREVTVVPTGERRSAERIVASGGWANVQLHELVTLARRTERADVIWVTDGSKRLRGAAELASVLSNRGALFFDHATQDVARDVEAFGTGEAVWLRLTPRREAVRTVVPAGDPRARRFIAERSESDPAPKRPLRLAATALRRAGVSTRLRVGAARRFLSVPDGEPAGRSALLASLERGDLEFPPAYVRRVAADSGSDLQRSSWGLVDPGGYLSRKALLFVLRSDDRPEVVVKIGQRKAAGDGLLNAATALRMLATRMPGSEGRRFPAVRFDGTTGSLMLVGEAYLEGERFLNVASGQPDDPLLDDALSWLTGLASVTAKPIAPSAARDALNDLVTRFEATYHLPAVGAELRALIDRIDEPIRTVFAHLDVGTHNLLAANGQVAFVDWEDAEVEGPPLWDLFHLLRGYAVWSTRRRRVERRIGATIRHFTEPTEFHSTIVQAVARYRHAIGLPAQAVEPLLLSGLVALALREATRLAEGDLGRGEYKSVLEGLLRRRSAPAWRRIVGMSDGAAS